MQRLTQHQPAPPPTCHATAGYITSDTSLQGLLAIPAVLGQLVQVFIGSALVPYCARYTARYCKAQKVAAEEAAEAAAAAALEGGAAADSSKDGGKSEPGAAASVARTSIDPAKPAAAGLGAAELGGEQRARAKPSSGVPSSHSAQSLSSEGGASAVEHSPKA